MQLLLQALPQQIRKEAVIAVPAPLIVQGDDKQVGAFEKFQGFLAGNSRIEHHGVTQGPAQALKDGGAQ